jgi:hypothetical protein
MMNKNGTFASRSSVLAIPYALAMALSFVACTQLNMWSMNSGGSQVCQALTRTRVLYPSTNHQRDPRASSSTVLTLSSEEIAAYEEETKAHEEQAFESTSLPRHKPCTCALYPSTNHQKDPQASSSTLLSLSSEEMAAYEEETKAHNQQALQSTSLPRHQKVP